MRSIHLLVVLYAGVATAHSLSLPAKLFFNWFKSSEAVAAIHRKHVQGDTVQHMLKSTPFAAAPDELKLQFARGPAGAAVSEFMRLEQQYIGDWKLERIVEAAGTDFDPIAARDLLVAEATTAPVVMFSFVDCPWCLLAKGALRAQISIAGAPEDALRVVELEELGREGKRLRAALAIATGRTSMPAVFINSRAIGGYTDGEPAGDEALCLAGSPGLKQLIEDGTFQGLLKSALASRDNRPRIGP